MPHLLDVEQPQVQPEGAPSGDFEEIRSTPNMFGALTAEGLGKFGEGAERAGAAGLDVLTEINTQNNQIHASELNSDFYNKGTDLVSQHTQLVGRAAMDALPALKQKLQGLQSDAEGAAGNLQTKAMVATNTRYALDRLMSIATTHSDNARNQWAKDTAQNNVLSATNFGSLLINAGHQDFSQLDLQMRTINYEAHNRWDGEFSNLADADQKRALDLEVAKTKGAAVKNWVETAAENQKDPNALAHAVGIFERYTGDIDAQSRLDIDKALKKGIFDHAARNLGDYFATPPGLTVDNTLSPQKRALLDTITGSETTHGSYNELYTGKDVEQVRPGFDYTDHPRVMFPAQYGPTSAFGRYQITQTSWDESKGRYGLTDITPASQDQWASKKADERYVTAYQNGAFKQFAVTGNLDEDLQANANNPQFLMAVGHALSGEWTSLPGGLQPNAKTNSFVTRFQKNIAIENGERPPLDAEDVVNAINADPNLAERPELRDAVTREALSKLSAEQRAFNLDAKKAKDTSDAAEWEIFKNIHSDNPTATLQQIDAAPLTKDAKERLTTDLEKATGKETRDDKTYGKGFYDLFQRIHAAPDDPQRITDPSVLYGHVGPNGDLTMAGIEKLRGEINGNKTPEGAAEGEMKKQFLANARAQISGTDEGMHIKDPKGDELYLKFLANFFPAYDQARNKGKSPSELLNPESTDYLGKAIDTYKRSPDKWYGDITSDQPGETSQKFDIATVKTLDAAMAAYKAGDITRDQARALAQQHPEWGVTYAAPQAANAPAVPMNH